MSEAVRAGRPWAEAVSTFLICLALGPPLGGLIFAACTAFFPAFGGLANSGNGWDLSGGLVTTLFLGLFAVPFSYLAGGVQAAATGLLFAAWGWFRGRPSVTVAMLVAAAVFAGSALGGLADEPELLPAMVLIHAVPTFLCWLIIRNFWHGASA